ncbi:FAD:protein FMN transferase [Actinoplanes sp. NBRC 14428]|uniref:FAD:protein FMN transferase n=1 Tax=Pseudosporangium ferrugineum TaxID=439699 RepID=A0A2T0RNX3_9ACTN|nr:FAD:protein FMN transferase [Pseudosporangium ferrugineum]PRY22895.1 thiamine biosynthesis lipoprotein [Pseudosporangium ferrugineum]BCJ55094.1 FAD:protein FMN transferase [Actinoplanes sp. NBRC 14428]
MHHAEHVMGTVVSIDLADDLPAPVLRAMIGDVCSWLHEVDRRFSTYRDDSEVSRLRRREIDVSDCSADLRHVLEACADLWRETDGYFDAYAAGPLDPSGYVKGWSVEVASARLAEAGSVNHCLNAGGDIRARGLSAKGEPWRVGIRHPWEPDKLSWVLAVTDRAVATSGIYERGDHVFNPRTREPAHGLRSVTVVGPDLALTDAYATAALAMGEAGLAWLAKLTPEGYESAAVTDDGRAFTSSGLPTAA